MIKKKFIAIPLVFLYCNNCLAEGQYGLARFMMFIQIIFLCLSIFIYTLIGGAIIKLILQKSNLLVKNQTYKAFSISLLIAILATMLVEDDFISYLWNNI
ncbi:MAG TPA: hypothetical protein VF465_03045 [Flavobacterium sp.]|uniref:hypothetical protein n=1 Tax=Flavobacterium sp. TaxID=239 RepID=UPI0028E762E9|nr:hypothetical protein [uncultured Flavobacterium sp.]